MGRVDEPSRGRPTWRPYALGGSLLLALGIWLALRGPLRSIVPGAETKIQPSASESVTAQTPVVQSPDSDNKRATAALQQDSEKFLSAATEERLQEHARALDPTVDGWDSEAVSQATNAQYKALAKLLEKTGGPSEAELDQFVVDDFVCDALLAADSSKMYSDGVIRVLRKTKNATDAAKFHGAKGLYAAIQQLLGPLGSDRPRQVKFKQFRIRPEGEQTQTTAFFHAFAETPKGPIEINATWLCWWRHRDERLQLARIDVAEFEQTSADLDSPTLFSDCTEAVAGDSAAFRERLLFDVATWRQRLPANLNLQYHGHIGLAVGDVNGDGLDDVYLCQPGGLPNALFLHQPDGTVKEAAADAGVDILNYTRGALFVDLDNDGDQDLILTVIDQLTFYANDGRGRFTAKAELPFIRGAYSISAADYDGDRDLDVYVCRHRADGHDKGEFPVPYPYYEANNGGPNFFLRNDGEWQFTDATADVGLDVDNSRFSFASSWEDFDNDGDLDLYVANDFGHNALYRNEGGKFVSVAEEIGLEDAAFGMSVSWGDYNRDGLMDLYVGNMFSAAGNRITFQDQFRPESRDESRKMYQRTARGNSLFKNLGDGTFQDVSVDARVTQGRWSWASLFADINNDGWEDLMVTNGFVTGDTIDDL